jgi:putative GTP pyrophosphokinase
MLKPSATERKTTDPLMQRFDEKWLNVSRFYEAVKHAIVTSEELKPLIHSMRARMKDRKHLEDKLVRKMRKCAVEGKTFEVTPDNLHVKINDLAGIRILHLHTAQAKEINEHLTKLIVSCGYQIEEGPEARTWDIEYEQIFKEMGFQTITSDTLYTSVHYVIADQVTCEIQVRTLSEEIWGEVDHRLNYPHKMDSVACRQQLRALARSTSASGRLVDAIFATVADEQSAKKARELGAKPNSGRAPKKKRT